VDRFQFCKNQTAITGTLHKYEDTFLSEEETVQGIPVWGIHSYFSKQREEFLVSFIPPTQGVLTPDDTDVSTVERQMHTRFWFEDLRRIGRLTDPGFDRKLLLKWILRK
jgi:hypothetical protein